MYLEHILSRARQIVLAAGDKAKDRYFGDRVIGSKPFGDFLTEADQGIDEFIVEQLQKEFPDHNIDSEEGGKKDKGSNYTWMLDPIDGTKYYVRKMPFYAVSMALQLEKKSILGLVYAPELRYMYSGVSGRGVTLNDKPISIGSEESLERASIYLEIPSNGSPSDQFRWGLKKMAVLVNNTCRVRILGVGSLGLCFCATGGFDAYVNLGSALKRWDTAAGRVILEEAGGMYLSLGDKDPAIVAGPKSLCTQIRKLLKL